MTEPATTTNRFSAQSWMYGHAKNLGMRASGQLAVPLDRLCGRRAGDTIGIVTYHRVAVHPPGICKPAHNVHPEQFRLQLEGLLSRGFSFISLRTALAARESNIQLPPRTALVTFDDGFQSVYTNAWPVLRDLKIPATIFVSTAYLDTDDPFPFDNWGVAYHKQVPAEDYRPLTTDQCHEMAADGLIDLGAHTHTHRDLRQKLDEFEEDLQISVDDVRARFGTPDVTFAFPWGSPYYGYAGGGLAAATRRTGVVCALTTECVPVELQSDPFTWGRFNAFPWDTGATLAAKLNGWYSWAPQLRQRIAKSVFRRNSSRNESAQIRSSHLSPNGAHVDAPRPTPAEGQGELIAR